MWLGRAARSCVVVVYHWIAPNMHVQTFAATHDAASTLLSLHVRLAFIAMLAATAARPSSWAVARAAACADCDSSTCIHSPACKIRQVYTVCILR